MFNGLHRSTRHNFASVSSVFELLFYEGRPDENLIIPNDNSEARKGELSTSPCTHAPSQRYPRAAAPPQGGAERPLALGPYSQRISASSQLPQLLSTAAHEATAAFTSDPPRPLPLLLGRVKTDVHINSSQLANSLRSRNCSGLIRREPRSGRR